MLSSRLSLFHLVFAQFATLQIIKSLKMFATAVHFSLYVPLTALIASSLFLQVVDPNSPRVAFLMYLSFLTTSLVDGSMSNHVVTAGVICLLMLSAFSADVQVWQTRAAKAITVFGALVYLGAGIHKLNSDFFNPKFSCANLFIAGAMSAFPSWVGDLGAVRAVVGSAVIPIGAALFEILLPLLILFTMRFDTQSGIVRRGALVVGALFHAFLALPPSPLSVYPFSAVMVPIYVFLVPLDKGLESLVSSLLARKVVVAFLGIVFGVAWQFAPRVMFGTADLFEYPNYGLWSCSLVWNLLAWSIVVYVCVGPSSDGFRRLSNPTSNPSPPSPSSRPSTILILFLFSLFPLSPYIGLRNYPALAMFANLRTEGTQPNTWLPMWDLFGHQKDWVEIRATNFAPLANFQIDLGELFPDKLKNACTQFGLSSQFQIAPPRWEGPALSFVPFSVPFVEVRRKVLGNLAQWNKGVYVDFVRHFPDGRVEAGRLDQASVMTPLSVVERLFVKFRSFSEEYSPCRH